MAAAASNAADILLTYSMIGLTGVVSCHVHQQEAEAAVSDQL